MVVAIVGITLASGPELTGAVSARPVVLAGVAAVGFGLALFCIDRGAQTSTLMTLWGMRGTSFVLFATLAMVLRRTGGVVAREVPALTLIGCADMAANFLFGLASSRGQVSVASVLASLYPVVTIVLARFVLGERLRRVQQVGAALSLVGAAVIAL
jgi:drug/metabolite transporter (DMT)-like permease